LKVLVLNPCSRFSKNVVRDVLYGCWCKGKRIGGGSVPPFALIQIATILKDAGHEVIFLDAQAEQKKLKDILPVVKKTDVIIISTSTMSFREDVLLLEEFKRVNQKALNIIFGSHPTFLPVHSLNAEPVDIIIRHEPYFILRDLLSAMNNEDEGWMKIRGIGYRHNGQAKINDFYPFMDLDLLPLPDVDLLPKKIDYFNPLVQNLPYITSVTSKGCPGKCTFCTAPNFDGNTIRFKSVDYVLNEMEYYKRKGFREIYFRDDTFFVNKRRDRQLCEEMLKRGLNLTWICNTRVDKVERNLFALAKQAGCHTVKIGIESGVQDLLDHMKKGYRIEQGVEVFRILSEIGINTHAHVMLGVPNETKETIRKTVDYVLKLNPTTATFGICTPYPGTPLYEELIKDFPEIGDGTQADFSRLHTQGVFNQSFTSLKSPELERCLRAAYRRFYVRPAYIFKILKQIRNMGSLKRVMISAANVIDFSIRGD